MIDLRQKQIVFEGTIETIKEWAVWFRTPSGLFRTLDGALRDADESQFPVEHIRAVPVAVSESLYEER